MLNALKDLLFILNMIDMLTFDDVCLLHALNCVLLVNFSVNPTHTNITKGTYRIYMIVTTLRVPSPREAPKVISSREH